MPSVSELIGTWTLVSWTSFKNGEPVGYPMGENCQGQIIYSEQGRMAAFLMHPDYPDKPRQTKAGADDCVAYGGTYRIDGEQVIHDVLYATLPHWVGHPLIRTMDYDGEFLKLKTAPETSRSGNIYESILVWQRLDQA